MTRRRTAWVAVIALAVAGGAAAAAVLLATGGGGGGGHGLSVDERCLLSYRCGPDDGDASWPVGQGGAATGGRFSPLTRIDRTSVRKLRVAWTFATKIVGNECYPVVVGDVAFVTTSYGNVYALDATTGGQLWSWSPSKTKTAPIQVFPGEPGYPNRGVAVGGGRVYAVTPNAVLVALDPRNGNELWSVATSDPRAYSLSSPPAYWRGVLYLGSAGAEDGARGYVEARRASDGSLLWRRYTVPRSDRRGGYGGGAVWMGPTLDPARGVLYVATGNPSPAIDGSRRPGPNRWTDSVLALDLKTGRMRWGYQEQPHDVWDYDAVSPPVRFPGGVGQASKGGLWFQLGVGNGKPLAPPRPFVKIDHPAPRRDGKARWVWPGGLHGGGSEWSPVPYDPQTGLVYVSGINSPDLLRVPNDRPVARQGLTLGSDLSLVGVIKPGALSGTFTAFAVDGARQAWQRRERWPLVGGATATAGGVVFTAVSGSGRLLALDARSGRTLWSHRFSGRIDAAPSVYSVRGREYVLVALGGSPIAAHGFGGKGAGDARFVALTLP